MGRITYNNVAEELLLEVPEFRKIFDEHLKDQNGNVLQYVLFGEFTRFVIDKFSDSKINQESKDVFMRSVDFIEQLLATGDSDLENIVAASFLENLIEQGNDRNKWINSMRIYFEPRTLELLEKMGK